MAWLFLTIVLGTVGLSYQQDSGAVSLPQSGDKTGAGKARQKSVTLDSSPDPNSPHSDDFEPRPGLHEGGGLWDFGEAHALVHHVVSNSPRGGGAAVIKVMDDFSRTHGLSFSLEDARGAAMDSAVERAVANRLETEDSQGLHFLLLGSGLGARTLRSVAPLMVVRPDLTHEVVSVDTDDHLLDGARQLVSHTLGDEHIERVRHSALMVGDNMPLNDLLESLIGSWGFPFFDMVSLDGGGLQEQQMEALLSHRALRRGSVVHAEGLKRNSTDLEQYLQFLHEAGRDRLQSEVHDLDDGTSVVVTTVHDEL